MTDGQTARGRHSKSGKRRITVLQHDCELGSLAGMPDVELRCISPKSVKDIPDPEACGDALVVVSGLSLTHPLKTLPPGAVGAELSLLEKLLENRTPLLAVGPASHLLALAAGAPHESTISGQVGWGFAGLQQECESDALFSGFPTPIPVFQLPCPESKLPAGAVRLAANRFYEDMAFRVGESAYGVRCQLMADRNMVSKWIGRYGDELENFGISRASLLHNIEARQKGLAVLNRIMVRRLLDLGDPSRKHIAASSNRSDGLRLSA